MLSLTLALLAVTSPPLLKPANLPADCVRAGYSLLQDGAGHPRVLRRRVNIPDNSSSQTQYYDERSRLLTLRASFSGFVGPLYDLTARMDGKGNIISVTGYRSKLYSAEFKPKIIDLALVQSGHCLP